MIADSTLTSQDRVDAGHRTPPSPRAQPQPDPDVESLRKLAADTRKALDAAHARIETLTASERRTRTTLAEAQAAIYARDVEYAATTRALMDRLSDLDPILQQRDAANRRALAAESRCLALESRVEHAIMAYPRLLARKFRGRFLRR